jgi:ubiquinone/menaquinone biosynthesis C-methylase UbiE
VTEPANTGNFSCDDATQTLAVKRAQVEFHNFASLGEPERVLDAYRRENAERATVLRDHASFIGGMSPFLEIGANAGHTSYMLANDFGCEGFALDLSADALRHGRAIQELWNLPRAPVRVAGDALNLPFRDGSLRMVMACQMLSQFMDIDRVFQEVKRVLAPGGTFVFVQEPIRRLLSLRLYRCPYERQMKPWERRLNRWGLLGYLVKDVIGAHQEESFGIRQNHRMTLNRWDRMVARHFVARKYEITAHNRGWGEHVMHLAARRLDRLNSEWLPAKLLGGTLAAACRKAGEPPPEWPPLSRFELYLRCPDCRGGLERQASDDSLVCGACGYRAPCAGEVYNLLPSAERSELYPGDRADVIDFSSPAHQSHLLHGWFDLEGVYGSRYRWIGPQAGAWLETVRPGPQRIRIRGFGHSRSFEQAGRLTVALTVNGEPMPVRTVDRPGLFVLEYDVPDAARYTLELRVSPTFSAPPDQRVLGVNIGMIRLVPRD